MAAVFNAPIVADKVGVRASGFEFHDGGYINNVALGRKNVNRANVYGGRVDLLFTPTDRLTVRVNGFLQDISRDGTSTADYTLAGVPVHGPLDQSHIAEPFDQHFRLVSGTVDYRWDPVTLTSISSYQTANTQFDIDATPLLAPLFTFFGVPLSSAGSHDSASD